MTPPTSASGLALDAPSADEIVDIGSRDWLDISADEAEDLMPAVSDLLALTRGLLAVRESKPGKRESTRDSGRRPTSAEDPFNVFTRVMSVEERSHGPLAGRRVGVKDNIDVAGVPTGNASPTTPYTPSADAVVVERILGAGARIVGKLNMDDYASGATGETSVHGPPRNPIDPTRSAGGSSGGSGAAVQCGAVDLALGGDQGGSARIPASFCGVVALKATHGLIPIHGMTHIGHSLDHVCPMARSVEETALLLGVIAGSDWRDPQCATPGPDVSDRVKRLDGRRLRIGLVRESVMSERCDPQVIANTRSTLAQLEDHGDVDEVSIPLWEHGSAITQTILAFIAGAMIRNEGEGRDHFGVINVDRFKSFAIKRRAEGALFPPYIKTWLLASRYMEERYSALPYAHLHNLRLTLRDNLGEMLSRYDVLITPTTPTTAPPLLGTNAGAADVVRRVLDSAPYNTAPLNLSGHPALAVPSGLDTSGMPTSVQIIGRPFDEALVLAVGRAVEDAVISDKGAINS
jgi:amidase